MPAADATTTQPPVPDDRAQIGPAGAPDRAPTPTTPPPATPRRTSGIVGIAIVIAVIAAWAAGHQLLATIVHAEVWPAWVAADARFDDAADDYAGTAERGERALRQGEALLEMAVGDLVVDEDRDALGESLANATEALADRPAGPGIADLVDPDSPAPAWERYEDVWQILGLIPSRDAAAGRFELASDRIASGTGAIADATESLVAGAEERAAAAVAEYPSATVASRVAAESAIAELRHAPAISSGSTSRYAELDAAIADLRASHAAAEAFRLEHPVRAEIEAFARSISHDVPFDVEWAYEVGGYSSDGYYSGTAEFFDGGEEGWGLISLTHSIEEAWTSDENAKAVVVHEVGHVQVLREECAAVFSGPQFGSDHETWATAWAIAMGYDLPGAGIEPYGRPSDAQIEAAAACA